MAASLEGRWLLSMVVLRCCGAAAYAARKSIATTIIEWRLNDNDDNEVAEQQPQQQPAENGPRGATTS